MDLRACSDDVELGYSCIVDYKIEKAALKDQSGFYI